MTGQINERPPLLTPAHVQLLSDQLAKLHGAIADADRIERCGFECGDLRATLAALSQTIQNMLATLGNVPAGAISMIGANPSGSILSAPQSQANGT